MIERIDLNAVPSAMEALAATWVGNKPVERRPQMKPSKPPRHRFVKPDPTPRKPSPAPKLRRDPSAISGERAQTASNQYRDKLAEEKSRAELQALLAEPEPEPEWYAQRIPGAVADELLSATRLTGNELRGLWQARESRLESQMMRLGLIGLIGKHRRILTHLGRAVRAELMKDEG